MRNNRQLCVSGSIALAPIVAQNPPDSRGRFAYSPSPTSVPMSGLPGMMNLLPRMFQMAYRPKAVLVNLPSRPSAVSAPPVSSVVRIPS